MVLPKLLLSPLFLILAWLPARSELVLTNFSSSRPLNVMAVGDSITDDCSLNGAWRLYLQPLLDTNGYPFTFVGRYASSPAAGFTKRQHEGFCGAVVAPPGVFGPVHNYPAANVYLEKTVADALTSSIPDLVLVLIGANDIGRGREPHSVATNDMPALLDLIFSRAPAANVLLAKATSLASAADNYGLYATNISVYNGALQAMANQRRSLGQNVSVADLFSVVDYSTMFMGDHIHPNALGLQAMAQEWFSRIQSITVTTNQVTKTLIYENEYWKYSDTGQDLGTNWTQWNYDDSGWSNGLARLGYGDPSVITTISYGADPTNRNSTTYFRHWFTVPEGVAITNLSFRLAQADGAVVWLNGQEAYRTNMPSGPISYTNLAFRQVNGEFALTFYRTNLAVTNLPAGPNLVAVELHPRILTRTAIGFDLELLGTGFFIPPPSLSISLSGGLVNLSWPLTNGAAYTLYSTSTLGTNWAPAGATLQTNAGQVTATLPQESATRFFRLQKP